MKPHRVIKRRKQSNPARHTNAAPHACVGELYMSIEPNPLRAHHNHHDLVVIHCVGCGRILKVIGVLPQSLMATNNDDQDDCA